MDVVIYGSRPDGHAKVVLDALRGVAGVVAVGLIDDEPQNRGRTLAGLTVLGDGQVLPTLTTMGVSGVVLGFGEHIGRTQISDLISSAGLAMPCIVHAAASVSTSAVIEEGGQVLARAHIGPDARLARAVLVNSGAIVEHDTVIAEGAVIGPGAVLAGRVSVGSEAMVGANATILPDQSIGAHALVGAGSVVTRDVPPGAIVVGVPAKDIGTRSA